MRRMHSTLFDIPPAMLIMHVATTPRPANANPFRIHTYESFACNSFNINTYETLTQEYQNTRL
jgi:hypothetical protein